MKLVYFRAIIFCALSLLGACTANRFYNTETPVLMDINDNNRVVVSGNIEFAGRIRRLEGQAAVKTFGRTYLVGGAMIHQGVGDVLTAPSFFPSTAPTAEYVSRTVYGHGALGGYFPIELTQGVSSMHFLAGVGLGSTNLRYTYNYPGASTPSPFPMPVPPVVRNYDMYWQYNRIYLQGHYLVTGKSLRSTLGMRISRFQYFNGKIDSKIDEDEFIKIAKLDSESPFLLIEAPWEIGYHNNRRFFVGIGVINNIRTGGLPNMSNTMYVRTEIRLGPLLNN
ncbi:MAG: hypothetical protein ACK4NS_09850 [Saprospiraceae bacterium]